jgi:rare lipoprotein A
MKTETASMSSPSSKTGLAVSLIVMAVLSACSTTPAKKGAEPAAHAPSGSNATPPTVSATPPRKSGGGYYLDDGPGDNPPPNLDLLPDAVPKIEKFASGANRPYNVFGIDYVPDLSGAPYKQRGVGSWYGRKFHGQRTSSGEIYDMYAMTAAHPTLPIPCYALVTNVQNGKSVIVRVNDRGPFLHNRIMDLSYAAAIKLGYLSSGSEMIEVEMLTPSDIAAGRIPITSNSLYIASAAARGDTRVASNAARGPSTGGEPIASSAVVASTLPPVVASKPTITTEAAPTIVAFATISPAPSNDASSNPYASQSMAASYAERGIPADLIPMADPQPAPSLPSTTLKPPFYLQLGAFRARAGADSFAAHLSRLIDPALASRVQVSDANGMWRVRVGPYAERTEADGAASSLRTAIAQPVLVMPDGVVR